MMATRTTRLQRAGFLFFRLAGVVIIALLCTNPLAAQTNDEFVDAGKYADYLEKGAIARFKKSLAEGGHIGWRAGEYNRRLRRQIRLLELSVKRLRGHKQILKSERQAYSRYITSFTVESYQGKLIGSWAATGRKPPCDWCQKNAADAGMSMNQYLAHLDAMRFEAIKLGDLEIKFVAPAKLKQAAYANVRFYPIDPKQPLVFEIKSVGDKPVDEIQLSFKLNRGRIKKFTLDGTSCAWNRNTNEGQCGFVSLAPGKSLKVGVILQVVGLDMTEQNRFIDQVSVKAAVKSFSLKERADSVAVTFEDCSYKLSKRLGVFNNEAFAAYHNTSFRALYANDNYLTKRINTPAKTGSSRLQRSNAIVMEMLSKKGLDNYLAGGAKENGKKLRDQFFDYLKRLKKNVRGGGICPPFAGPDAGPLKAASALRKRADDINIRAVRTRRQAARWRKAILKAIAEVGDKTGKTALQDKDAREGTKAFERKTLGFGLNRGLQWALTPVGATASTAVTAGKIVGGISLAVSVQDILTATRDFWKLNFIGMESFEALAMIETAAHLKVLDWRYQELVKANDEYIQSLRELHKTHCSCRVPFD